MAIHFANSKTTEVVRINQNLNDDQIMGSVRRLLVAYHAGLEYALEVLEGHDKDTALSKIREHLNQPFEHSGRIAVIADDQ